MGTLICTALPFGYGPSAKLITLARTLRPECRLVFVGRGTALELARRTSDLFESVLECSVPDAADAIEVTDVRGVLSLMDPEAGTLARALGAPLFVVDSLLWMRPEVPEPLRGARVYWAQRFPGLDAESYSPRPALVGPIVAPPSAPSAEVRHGLVVNLGGSSAPDGRQGLYAAYARFVLDAVERAGLPDRFGRVTVLGGAAVIHTLAGCVGDARIAIESASLDAARDRMAFAEAVLTAPGLTTTLECFQAGTPTWFLPPQNYSQWCILRHLREAHAADDALHWEDLADAPRLSERLRPADRDPLVVSALRRFTEDARSAELLRWRLVAVGAKPSERIAAQSRFFTALGSNGSVTIARALRELCV